MASGCSKDRPRSVLYDCIIQTIGPSHAETLTRGESSELDLVTQLTASFQFRNDHIATPRTKKNSDADVRSTSTYFSTWILNGSWYRRSVALVWLSNKYYPYHDNVATATSCWATSSGRLYLDAMNVAEEAALNNFRMSPSCWLYLLYAKLFIPLGESTRSIGLPSKTKISTSRHKGMYLTATNPKQSEEDDTSSSGDVVPVQPHHRYRSQRTFLSYELSIKNMTKTVGCYVLVPSRPQWSRYASFI